MMGGRGAGKTRAGAEWVRSLIESGRAKRIALVGPTLHDVREVMIEGPSGLKAVASDGWAPTYEVSRRRLVWPDGTGEAYAFSAEDPDSLRGPQFDAAWCDEIGAWAKDTKTWDTMMFGLRLGACPRVAATTTPRARKLVQKLAELGERDVGLATAELAERDPPVVPPSRGDDPLVAPPVRRSRVVITRAATKENAMNLSPGWVEEMEQAYRGSHLARQELDGELVEDLEGAIFTRTLIEAGRARAEEALGLERVVVAVDPPAGAGEKAAACGIVCAGVKGEAIYVLEDASVRGMRPLEWARRVADVAKRRGAGAVIAESNQGGEMVRELLGMAGAGETARVRLRSATQSKRDRAEPVSAAYEQGRVRHVGVFRELEDEMCSFGTSDARPSPDRVDALVWAVRELMQKPKGRPGIEAL
jgi:phage terminase large subunit-like protein